MSNIKVNPAISGDVASAASVNATYAAIAAGTVSLTDTNTQTEWCTFNHVDTTTNDDVFNTDLNEFCDSTHTYTLASESYTLINLGAGAAPVQLNWAPTLTWQYSNEMIRVHADINVDAIGQLTLPSIMGSNQDCFYLQLWYRDGTGTYHALPCEWAYSVTNYTEFDVTAVVIPTQPNFDAHTILQNDALSHPRHRFRCSVTGFIPVVASGVNRIELRGKIDTLANLASVTFKEATMTAIMVRH